MSKHDHPAPKPPCIHEGTLKFCGPCNAVECSACGFEWTAPSLQAKAFSGWAIAPSTRPHRDEPYRWSGPWLATQAPVYPTQAPVFPTVQSPLLGGESKEIGQYTSGNIMAGDNDPTRTLTAGPKHNH